MSEFKQVFTIYSKPQSVNSLYYGNAKIKTQAARDWSYKIFHQLSSPEDSKKFEVLRKSFDPKKHGYYVTMTHYFPESVFYTKSGEISARTQDITNVEKPLVDLLFLSKYFDKRPPYGMENLNIDDKHLLTCVSNKLPINGDEFKIEVEISIVDHPVLSVPLPEDL